MYYFDVNNAKIKLKKVSKNLYLALKFRTFAGH